MIAADQILAHLVGDYLLQSDWMAQEKTKRWSVALFHAFTYALPFLFFRPSLGAFLVIWLSHALIDRYRLARFVVYAKNFLAPSGEWVPNTGRDPCVHGGQEWVRWWFQWSYCSATGYSKDRPPFLAVWLLIIADNTLHLICNGLALRFLP